MGTNSEMVTVTSKLEIPKEDWEAVEELIEELDPSGNYGKKHKVEKAFELLNFMSSEWLSETYNDVSISEAERRLNKVKEVFRR